MAKVGKPAVDLRDLNLGVKPGSSASTRLILKNNTPIAGRYRLSVADSSIVSGWATFHRLGDDVALAMPNLEVPLLPTDEVEIVVTVTPPAIGQVPAGKCPYLIAIDSLVPEHESTAVEGIVDITPIAAINTRVMPKKVKGRRGGRCRVAVRNEGTAPARVRLQATEYDGEQLSVAWQPRELELRVGQVNDFLVELKPREVMLVGEAKQHGATFAAQAVTPAGVQPPGAGHPVAYEQPAWIPKAAIPFLAVLVAVLAFGVYWLNRPPPAEPGANPDPPTALSGFVSEGSVQLSWTPGSRAKITEIGMVDCTESDTDVPTRFLDRQEFEGVAVGTMGLNDAAGEIVCFRGRSLDGDEQASKWSDVVKVATPTLTAPVIAVENGFVIWDTEPGVEYKMLINKAEAKTFLEGGVPVAALELIPGPNEIQLLAVRDDQVSPPSNSVSVEGPPGGDSAAPGQAEGQGQEEFEGEDGQPSNNEASVVRPDGPWVFLRFTTPEVTAEDLVSVQALVAQFGGEFGQRGSSVQHIQLPDDFVDANGDPVVIDRGNGLVDELAGKFVFADVSGGLTSEEAARYCGLLLLNATNSSAPVLSDLVCWAFDASGQQLQQPTATAEPTDE